MPKLSTVHFLFLILNEKKKIKEMKKMKMD